MVVPAPRELTNAGKTLMLEIRHLPLNSASRRSHNTPGRMGFWPHLSRSALHTAGVNAHPAGAM